MAYSTYVKWGAGAGLVGGVISSEYYEGKSNPVDKKLNQTQKDSLVIYLAEAVCPTTIPKSTICLLGGPITGAGMGTGLYGIKNYRRVTRPAQAITWLIAVTAVSAFSAYNIGNRD